MTLVVADASALVEYLLRSTLSDGVAETVESADVDLHVPALADVEVASALRGMLLSGDLDETRAFEAAADYEDLPVTRHGHVDLLERVIDLRRNFSAYDATYLALAEALAATLLTCDQPLARAVHAHAPSTIVRAVTADA